MEADALALSPSFVNCSSFSSSWSWSINPSLIRSFSFENANPGQKLRANYHYRALWPTTRLSLWTPPSGSDILDQGIPKIRTGLGAELVAWHTLLIRRRKPSLGGETCCHCKMCQGPSKCCGFEARDSHFGSLIVLLPLDYWDSPFLMSCQVNEERRKNHPLLLEVKRSKFNALLFLTWRQRLVFCGWSPNWVLLKPHKDYNAVTVA